MPDRCVVANCSNSNSSADTSRGISLHKIPYFGDERAVAKHRRKLWINFVQTKRAKWKASQHSCICSEHFKSNDFEQPKIMIPGFEKKSKPVLTRDGIGTTAVPSIHAPEQPEERASEQASRRERRNVSCYEFSYMLKFNSFKQYDLQNENT